MKKELKWRLSDLPTGSEVAELVKQEVITKEEARDILFNETKTALSKDREDELKRQIEFLEELVKDLSKRQQTVISTTYVDRWVERYKPYMPNVIWCSSNVAGSTVTGANSNMSLANYTQQLIG